MTEAPQQQQQQSEPKIKDLSPQSKAEDAQPSVKSEVAKWCKRIKSAKEFHSKAFTRIRDDMEFHGGIQWSSQEDLNDDRYIANITMREVNQRVASLYARNPKAVCKRRERRDYTIWDGTQETKMHAAMTPFDPMSMLIIQDIIQGDQRRMLIDMVADTMEKSYQIQLDRLEPDFKLQMKQLVRRTSVCGVGFVRACFKREDRVSTSQTETNNPLPNRLKKLTSLVSDYEDRKFDENDSKLEDIKLLFNSVQYSMTNPTEMSEMNERLVFDFPSALSVIVDPACKIMKGFVGAKWIAVEYCMPLSEIREFFEKPDVNTTKGVQTYTSQGKETPSNTDGKTDAEEENGLVWEVFNKVNRTRVYICDGYPDYLMEPEEPRPCLQRFWPVIALTFNDTETEHGLKTSIYPPSDVRLMRSMQMGWNTKREALKKHTRSNRAKYLTFSGQLTDEDKLKLKTHPDNAVIEVKTPFKQGDDINKILTPFKPVPIDPAVYETDHLEKDVLLTIGQQQANLGPITNRGTATEATISEQSRVSSVSSNVDDLDDLLTEMARVGGEMMLREMSLETMKRDVGQGAVWPGTDQSRNELLDRIYLEVQAASTGRPNQSLQIAHIRDLAPILLQAGANPMFIVELLVKAFDERIDLNKAFPVIPPGMGMSAPAGGLGGSQLTSSAPSVPNPSSAGASPSLPGGSDASRSNNFNPS